jgi:hypothetical protein
MDGISNAYRDITKSCNFMQIFGHFELYLHKIYPTLLVGISYRLGILLGYYITNDAHLTRDIYNRPWLTWIVGVAYFQRHKLVAVLDALLTEFQMTFDSSRTNRMGGDDDIGDVTPMYYMKCHRNSCFSKLADVMF